MGEVGVRREVGTSPKVVEARKCGGRDGNRQRRPGAPPVGRACARAILGGRYGIQPGTERLEDLEHTPQARAPPQHPATLSLPPLLLPPRLLAPQGFNTSSYVHHIVGYVCAAGVVPPTLNTPYMCGPGQTVLPVGCETVNYVWTPGANGFTAPPQAGFAMGAGSATFLVLQVHYLNVFAVGQVRRSEEERGGVGKEGEGSGGPNAPDPMRKSEERMAYALGEGREGKGRVRSSGGGAGAGDRGLQQTDAG